MIKLLLIAGVVVLGLVGVYKTTTLGQSSYDDNSVPGFIFIASFICCLAGAAALGMALASY